MDEVVGPIFTPMGFWIPRKNSMCAPSICRVRSPIQMKWAEVSYHDVWSSEGTDLGALVTLDGSLSFRVRLCSYSRRRPSWLVYKSTVSRALSAEFAPTVRMKLNESVMDSTVLEYLACNSGS